MRCTDRWTTRVFLRAKQTPCRKIFAIFLDFGFPVCYVCIAIGKIPNFFN